MVIYKITAPGFPETKKRRAHAMIKKIKKKQQNLQDPLDEVVVKIEFEDDSDQSPLRNDNIGFTSPQRDSLVNSTFEETGSLNGSLKASNVDTSTKMGDSSNPSIPE